jgi:hypothetical protein
MAFGSTSKAFAFYVFKLGGGARILTSDTFKVALFKNTVSPTNKFGTATKTKTKYAGTGSTWSTANEVSGTGYTAGGKTVTSPTWTQTTANLKFTSATNPSWTSATITSFGALVYDTTTHTSQVNMGLCYLSFGGQQKVTAGTFTVTWNSTGIVKFAC